MAKAKKTAPKTKVPKKKTPKKAGKAKRTPSRTRAKSAKKPKTKAGMADAAVKAKTGRTWPEWVATLDALGARALDHPAIVKLVGEKFKIGPWWRQMVTVGYERLTDKRTIHETASGFVANVSKVCAASAKALFEVIDDVKTRKNLLGADVSFSTRHPGKTLRFAWPNDASRVVIALYKKAKDKAQVVVQHEKLAKAADVERAKAFWRGVVAKAEQLAKR